MKFVSPTGTINLSDWTFDTPAIYKEFLAAIEIVITEIVSDAYLFFPIQYCSGGTDGVHGPAVKDPSMIYMQLLFDPDNEGVRLEFSLREVVEDFLAPFDEGEEVVRKYKAEPAKALRDEFRAIADLIDEKLSVGGQQ